MASEIMTVTLSPTTSFDGTGGVFGRLTIHGRVYEFRGRLVYTYRVVKLFPDNHIEEIHEGESSSPRENWKIWDPANGGIDWNTGKDHALRIEIKSKPDAPEWEEVFTHYPVNFQPSHA